MSAFIIYLFNSKFTTAKQRIGSHNKFMILGIYFIENLVSTWGLVKCDKSPLLCKIIHTNITQSAPVLVRGARAVVRGRMRVGVDVTNRFVFASRQQYTAITPGESLLAWLVLFQLISQKRT